MKMKDHYTTKTLPFQPRHAAAEVLHGTWAKEGVYVAITITVRGSSWICHPARNGDQWHRRNRWGGARVILGHGTPPRHIRKSAKMALRRFLGVTR